MKKYTQEEFDALPRDECGYKECPTGDYTGITEFGNGCRFGGWCSFGRGCRFGNWCSFSSGCSFGKGCSFGEYPRYEKADFECGSVKDGRFIKVGPLGTENRDAYFFRDCEGSYFVRAGCWFSGMDAFVERVKAERGGIQHEKAYLAACGFAKAALGGEGQ